MPRNYTTRRERRTLWIAFFLLLALAAFLLWQELSPWEKAPATNPPAVGLTLRVIDVGQAQSLLLTCGEDAILVDAGEYAAGGQVLAALSRAGVKSLTAAILTHPHGDHYGGMRTVLEKIPTAAFYTSAVPEEQLPTTLSYEKLLDTLSGEQIPAAYLFAGDTLTLGEATVTVLAPARGALWEKLNNYSLVLRVTYGNTAILLKGDAEAEAEANRKIAESLTDALIAYTYAESWNGALPTFMTGDTTLPMFDMSALLQNTTPTTPAQPEE